MNKEKKKEMADKISGKQHFKESKTKGFWIEVAETINNANTLQEQLEYIYNILNNKRAFKYKWIAKANKVGMEQAIEEIDGRLK